MSTYGGSLVESLSAPPLALPGSAVEASGPSFPPAQQTWFQVAGRKHEAGARSAVQVDSLWMYEFWTPNPAAVTWCIVQDIDESDGLMKAWDPAIPAPHWVIENPATGHVQIGHVIDAVTHGPASMASGHTGPWRYLCAVQRSMARAYGADLCFTGQRCRNPFFAGARVWMRPDLPAYGLRDLHAALEASGLWDPSPIEPARGSVAGLPEVPTGVVATEGDRNNAVFDACRLAAYRGEDHVAAAHDVLCIPPLPASEVEGIIRSVEGYMGRTGRRREGKAMNEEHRRIQSERGKRGGAVRSDA
ncbi:replication initiation protein, partial [Kocuria palustris]|uniref:replication initiation protein n=2 Tax=Actinomycetes TaxID=1760 RepID=UPI003D76001A